MERIMKTIESFFGINVWLNAFSRDEVASIDLIKEVVQKMIDEINTEKAKIFALRLIPIKQGVFDIRLIVALRNPGSTDLVIEARVIDKTSVSKLYFQVKESSQSSPFSRNYVFERPFVNGMSYLISIICGKKASDILAEHSHELRKAQGAVKHCQNVLNDHDKKYGKNKKFWELRQGKESNLEKAKQNLSKIEKELYGAKQERYEESIKFITQNADFFESINNMFSDIYFSEIVELLGTEPITFTPSAKVPVAI